MEIYFKYQDNLIKEYPAFVYEVEIFKMTNDSWNLEESTFYSATTPISGLIEVTNFSYVGYTLIKYVTLIAAPSKWLKENAIKVEIESAKEKRRRIKEEKLKIKEEKI